jgi:hypothetical protein
LTTFFGVWSSTDALYDCQDGYNGGSRPTIFVLHWHSTSPRQELRIWYEKTQTTKKRGSKSIEEDLFRLVSDSVIALVDWELDDDDHDDDAGSAAAARPGTGSAAGYEIQSV